MNTLLEVRIRENSWLAAWAAGKLGSANCALVIGKTIHLHGASGNDLMNNVSWLRHEICHVRQWERDGYLVFLLRYLWFSIVNGYQNNPYEVEARQAEQDPEILYGVSVQGENTWLE